MIDMGRTEAMLLHAGKKLEGLNALITGASRGIGKEIALALAGEGADVTINYKASDDDADQVAREIESLGKNTWVYQADISKMNEVLEMKRSVEKYMGKVDILVNNAGINRDTLMKNMDEDDWKEVISINLDGVFNCTRAFLEHVVQSKQGRVINISSVVGQMGNIGQVNYAASKAGIIGMTKSLAMELAKENITVNAVAPGFVETSMLQGVPDDVRQKILKKIPLKRFGRPRDVARAVVFLASRDADYITGHVLNVNGGLYL